MVPKFVYSKHSRETNYMQCMEELFSQLSNNEKIESYFPPFVVFCGTTLEYFLNDLIVEYCSRYFREQDQRKFAESFMSMGFNAKLTTVVPIITGNKFQINIESPEYKTLCQIITRRNQIAHGKDFYIGQEPEDINPDGSFSISLNNIAHTNFFSPQHAGEPDDFKNAINSFYNHIYLSYFNGELISNSLILKLEVRVADKAKFERTGTEWSRKS